LFYKLLSHDWELVSCCIVSLFAMSSVEACHTIFKCLGLIHHYFKLLTSWRPFLSHGHLKPQRVYSRIFAKVCAVAMATGLVKNKA